MGVKGLLSLLTSEPNRFGQRFISSKDVDYDIYIDAPALLYHLIQLYEKIHFDKERKEHYPSIFQQIVTSFPLQNNLDPILSPIIIYELTKTFFITLRQCIGVHSEIHLVMDGVASVYKVEQQVTRLKQAAIELDEMMTQIRKRGLEKYDQRSPYSL